VGVFVERLTGGNFLSINFLKIDPEKLELRLSAINCGEKKKKKLAQSRQIRQGRSNLFEVERSKGRIKGKESRVYTTKGIL